MNATILKDFELTDQQIESLSGVIEQKFYCKWCRKQTQLIWIEADAPYASEDQGIGHWECEECHTWNP